MPFSEWKIEICFFTLSCRIDLCRIIIFITNFKKPQKKSYNKYHESFQLSQNEIDIFTWVKMERRFWVRTVCSLVCELSQSRSEPLIQLWGSRLIHSVIKSRYIIARYSVIISNYSAVISKIIKYVEINILLSKSESVKFLLIESVICLFTDLPANKIFFTVKTVNFHRTFSEKIFFTVKSVNFRWNNQWNLTDLQ